jgi:putative membrane protein
VTNASANAGAGKFEVRASASDHFAWLRTRLRVERTLMSWVRTAVSLIGFGFTIVQFFDRLGTLPAAAPALLPDAPRYMGLMLIGCGIFALIVSIWQYHYGVSYLWSGSFATIAGVENERRQTPLLAVCIVLTLIGLFAFFAVLFRLL